MNVLLQKMMILWHKKKPQMPVAWLFICLSLSVGKTALAEKTVNFLNWGQYIPPQVISDFTKKTGIVVNQSFFDGSDMLRAKLMAGNGGYDVVVPALVDFQQEVPAGIFQPIDKTQIPNYHLLSKVLYDKTAQIDPDNRYGVIYSWGTTGFAYNVEMIRQRLGKNAPVHSWKLLLDKKYLKKLKGCGVGFLADGPAVFAITLHYLGLNPHTHNPQDYIKAARYLMTLRPYITYFNNNNPRIDLPSGNLCISMVYSGDIMRGIIASKKAHTGIDIRYVIPQSGAPIFFDMLAIPKSAPHPQEALTFINYLISPKVAARVSNYLLQPNATPASTAYLLPLLQQPNMTPPPHVIKTLFSATNPPVQLQQLVSQLWLEVQYGIPMGHIQ